MMMSQDILGTHVRTHSGQKFPKPVHLVVSLNLRLTLLLFTKSTYLAIGGQKTSPSFQFSLQVLRMIARYLFERAN